MSDILNIAISGLKAQQTALTVTGNNITNAGTEGYSRQQVNFNENDSQFRGGVWVGSGVSVDSVRRVYDEFLTGQLRSDTSSFNQYQTLANYSEQIDSLLADTNTGIQPGLKNMFDAMQTAVDDPSSLAAREVLISQASALTDRFDVISDQLNQQNLVLNGQMSVMAQQITAIGESIASLNQDIQFAVGYAQGEEPNALMDQRDRLIVKLAEMVDVSVVDQGDNRLNVFIGNGQALVVGNDYNELYADNGSSDPIRSDLYLSKGNEVIPVSGEITGGTLGGMLDFRNQVLDPVMNNLGKMALVIAQTINEQHQKGLDFEGILGQVFFADINDPYATRARVLGDDGNANPDDRQLSIQITDAGALTASDYQLEFVGPDNYNYRIRQLDTNQIVQKGAITGAYPETIRMPGFDIQLDGGSFQAGDEFRIMPTRNEAPRMSVAVTRAEQVALASPIITDAAIGNRGSATITAGSVDSLDTRAFDELGGMTPPLLIRFTSATTYDVLDNTDPGKPLPLFPPIANQTYVPGIKNTINLGEQGQVAISSFNGQLPIRPLYQADPPAATVTATNGLAAQRFGIRVTAQDSGLTRELPPLNTSANTSARSIAEQLSAYDGITASARTSMQITDFTNDRNGFLPLEISLNGVVLTDTLGPGQSKYDDRYPVDVADPMTPDFLAERINANYDFQKLGIIASSDGGTLTITALNGDDLALDVSGDQGDGFAVSNGQSVAMTRTGESPYRLLNAYEGYDFSKGGPYSWSFDIPDQGRFDISLTDNYASGDDLLAGIKQALSTAGFAFNGNLDVAIDERGDISFQSRMAINGTGVYGSSKLAIGGQVKVVLDDGVSLQTNTPGNNLFAAEPQQQPTWMGINVSIYGAVMAGDEFTIGNNVNASSDNRNAVLLSALQNLETVGGNSTYSQAYASVVERVGAITSRAQTNRDSSEVLLTTSQEAVSSSSGVNLDEEAAALMQYELAYNANAQVIQVARDMFNTLIGTF
jgi:flagellar hook-associated protein 1